MDWTQFANVAVGGIPLVAVVLGLAMLAAGLYLVFGLGWCLVVLGLLLLAGGVIGSVRGGR